MNEKITYCSKIPSLSDAKIEKLTKTEIQEKFCIQWEDFNKEDKVNVDLYEKFPVGHGQVAIAEMGECGKGVFAIVDIEEGTPLFCYGGQTSNNDLLDLYQIERIETGSGESISISAKQYRNYGGYLQHLPRIEELEEYGFEFSENEVGPLATQNVSIKKVGNQILITADERIQAGEILGYSYGHDYWIQYGHAPFLFTKRGERIEPKSFFCHNVMLKVTDIYNAKDIVVVKAARKTLEAAANNCTKNYITAGPEGDRTYISPNVLKTLLNTDSEFYMYCPFGRKNINLESIANKFSIFSTQDQPYGPYADAYSFPSSEFNEVKDSLPKIKN